MYRSSPTWMAVLPLLLASALAAPPAGAGSLEVLVRDQDGQPLSRRVLVKPLSNEARRELGERARALWAGDLAALRARLNPHSTTDSGGRASFEGLPDGRYRISVSPHPREIPPERNPHFLPAPVLGWRIPLELERGGLLEPVLEIEGLGGAIELRGVPRRATTAVAVDAGGERREVAVDGGVTLLPSLVPGTYQLRLHATGVDEPVAAWDGLEVRAGVTLRVDAGTSPPGSESSAGSPGTTP